MSPELLALLAILVGLLLWKRKMELISISIGAIAVFSGCSTITYTIVVKCEFLTQWQMLGITGIIAILLSIALIAIAEQL